MPNKSPCYNCADRTLKCHSTCESYLKFRKNCSDLQDERQKHNDIQSYFWQITGKIMNRKLPRK